MHQHRVIGILAPKGSLGACAIVPGNFEGDGAPIRLCFHINGRNTRLSSIINQGSHGRDGKRHVTEINECEDKVEKRRKRSGADEWTDLKLVRLTHDVPSFVDGARPASQIDTPPNRACVTVHTGSIISTPKVSFICSGKRPRGPAPSPSSWLLHPADCLSPVAPSLFFATFSRTHIAELVNAT